VVKSYTTETVETDRVEETSRDYLDAQWDAITTRIRFWPTLRLSPPPATPRPSSSAATG
jgi:ATP-binding cassette subfamily B protein